MKRADITDPFLLGYLDAALFITDPKPGQGDYAESGRADEFHRTKTTADLFLSSPSLP